MLERSTKFMEEALQKAQDALDTLVLTETVELVEDWNKRFPRYEFQIGCHDLCSFRYRKKNEENWEELDHYSPSDYKGTLLKVALEASKFSDAYCALDTRFCASSFGWIGKEGYEG
jgi:hypothetical protein